MIYFFKKFTCFELIFLILLYSYFFYMSKKYHSLDPFQNNYILFLTQVYINNNVLGKK